MNFHKVYSVDIVNSVIDLIVWLRIQWVDPRLTWKPEEYGGLNNKTWFWIGDGGAGVSRELISAVIYLII